MKNYRDSMAIRANHYDAAVEEYLRSLRVPYVAVDEKRRALFGDDSLKSLDFIIDAPRRGLLVDVKGRRFGGSAGAWENWATDDDIVSMTHWQTVFGDRFRAALVFAYWLDQTAAVPVGYDPFEWGGRRYVFAVARVDDYAALMKERSASWGTVTVRRAEFRQIHQPLHELFDVDFDVDAA